MSINQQDVSQQQWQGINPQRFHHTEKVHLTVQDCLSGFQGGSKAGSGGRQHFEPSNGIAEQWKPHLKVDIDRPKEGTTQEFMFGKKFIDVEPLQKKQRAQRSHLSENKSGHVEDMKYGIKTFKVANQSTQKQNKEK